MGIREEAKTQAGTEGAKTIRGEAEEAGSSSSMVGTLTEVSMTGEAIIMG